ncbi:MAG: methyl-accepting chemotaxis protein [Terracidiphilus sp.]|jgi:methyl-accepting chemotaxis protein
MFGQMKIKTTILSILAVLAGGYLLLLAMVQLSSTATHRRMSEISSSLFPAALKMQEAEAAFERMKRHYGDAVVLQDFKSLDGAEKDAEAAAAALEDVKTSLGAAPELGKQADDLLAQFSLIRSRDHDTYTAILGAKDGPSEDLMAQVGALGKDNKAFSDTMVSFDKTIATNFQNQLDAVDAYSARSQLTGLVMLVFVVLVCAIAWWVIQHKIVRPLSALALRMQDIADGDLTRRVEVNGRNEIDEAGTWFNVFIGRIEEIVRSVAEHASTLGQAATELAATARETAGQAAQQQEKAGRITTTMNEMSSAIQEISQTTQSAAMDARKAEESAQAGGETVQATVLTIGNLLKANEETSTKIEELGRSSDAIGRIINVIDEIAGQTNLLALNASIEAARAGEHGRGFAVVAGEVRRLAERTSAATKEIDVTVHAIQEGTKVAVEAMRASMHHVQDGVNSARSAGEALTSIIHGSESVQKMVTQIAAAATEQSHSTQSVSANVGEIATIIEQTASSSEQSVEACQQLELLANELTSLVGAFKVGQGGEDGNATTQRSSAGTAASRNTPLHGFGRAVSAISS